LKAFYPGVFSATVSKRDFSGLGDFLKMFACSSSKSSSAQTLSSSYSKFNSAFLKVVF
jgi:hypothetical protein